MIRRLPTGEYRIVSRAIDPRTGKHRNLGTYRTFGAAQTRERQIRAFKRHA